jgi:hypothetical protein
VTFVLGMICGAALLALWADVVTGGSDAEVARGGAAVPRDVGILPGDRLGGGVR